MAETFTLKKSSRKQALFSFDQWRATYGALNGRAGHALRVLLRGKNVQVSWHEAH